MKNCNICQKNKSLKNFIKFGKFPFANFPVDFKKFKNYIIQKKLTKKLSDNLDLQFCSSCNYLQLKKVPNDKILNDIYTWLINNKKVRKYFK